MALYLWNIQLAEALLPSLSLFEVTLRNSVHTTLTDHARATPNPEFWFKHVLHQRMYDNITDLIARITRRNGIPPSAGKVISEITFGFWPLLFSRSYNSLWWQNQDPLIAHILPHYRRIARDTRSIFEMRLEYFAMLRNRVMHHEAIFQGVAAINRPVLAIDILHQQLLETLGWINEDAVELVSIIDHFDVTFINGRQRIESELRRHFGA